MRLFGFVEFRTLVAIVGAIVVHLDFYVGFYEESCLWEAEFEILDGESAIDPLLFVVGSNAENVGHFRIFVRRKRMIEIIGAEFDGKLVFFDHQVGIGEQKVGVCFEVNETIVRQDAAIAFEKVGGGKTFGHLFHLRIGKSEPNLGNFAGGEELIDKFDVGSQETDVVHFFFVRFRCPAPHAGALDIDADKILFGEEFTESHAIFSASTTEFEHDGAVVFEEIAVPFAAKRVGRRVRRLKRGFDNVGVGRHLGKLGEFVLTHGLKVS